VKEKALIAKALLDNVWPLLDNSDAVAISPLISQTFPLEKASEAHQLMESNQHMGKILLTINH
jgi:NADPH:quinone reductase-like Zn-dependent oxidoreductase